MSNGEKAAGDGRTIKLNGVTYAKGLGVHAASDVRYNLGSLCTSSMRFMADVGIDDEIALQQASIIFQVWADGVLLYDSGIMKFNSTTQQVNVDITGKNTLQLIVTDAGDGRNSDHGDWAAARIVCENNTQ